MHTFDRYKSSALKGQKPYLLHKYQKSTLLMSRKQRLKQFAMSAGLGFISALIVGLAVLFFRF